MEHETLMSAKIALLELFVRELYIDKFLQDPNPNETARAFAEQFRFPVGAAPSEELGLAGEKIWRQWMDGIVAGVRARTR
jgi:hypothetical protein